MKKTKKVYEQKHDNENKYLFLLDELSSMELNSLLKSNTFTKEDIKLIKRVIILKTITEMTSLIAATVTAGIIINTVFKTTIDSITNNKGDNNVKNNIR